MLPLALVPAIVSLFGELSSALPFCPLAVGACGTCQLTWWQTLMLTQVSNNRPHFIITRVQPLSLIWVTLTLDFFFCFTWDVTLSAFISTDYWTTLKVNFLACYGKWPMSLQTNPNWLGKAQILAIGLEFAWKIGCHVWATDTWSSSGRLCMGGCVCIWTCLGQGANPKCTSQTVSSVWLSEYWGWP